MPLTTTSYAILGLLDLRDWSAYELAGQAARSLVFVWPISESQLYAEPKRLERDGLITVRADPAGPHRQRQVLSITAAGRTELRRWLASEPAPPRLHAEVLLRTLFAPAGTRRDLLASLDATRGAAEDAFETGLALVEAYRAGDNPFPERLHANVLWMIFVRDMLELVLDWTDFAEQEVSRWTDASAGDAARADELLAQFHARTRSRRGRGGPGEREVRDRPGAGG